MISIETFTFNMFQENTYVVYDETKQCILIDPGMYEVNERKRIEAFLQKSELTPVHLVNTHCHIDHILGNKFIADKYNLPLTAHRGEAVVLEAGERVAQMYGIPNYMPSPEITVFLEQGDTLSFGNTALQVLFCPGHSPASICLWNREEAVLIAGDVLFLESIGRTDLPGGNHHQLLNSIRTELFPLPDETRVYPGHGRDTTIGHERRYNPFLV